MRVSGANYLPADVQGRKIIFQLLGEQRPQSAEDTRSEASKDRRLCGQPGILAGARHQCHGYGRLMESRADFYTVKSSCGCPVAGCNCLILAV
jgi:hypothetical protein